MSVEHRNIPARISKSRHSRLSGRAQLSSLSVCSCSAARARRAKTIANRTDPRAQLPELKVPEPLEVNQGELCVALERAVLSGEKTARAAKELLAVLQPHLLHEEEDLLQVLGLLVPIAQGQVTQAMRSIPAQTERLKSRMFVIAREHTAIIQAARKLIHAANREGKLEVVAFVRAVPKMG
jgi:hypothetical protein